MIDRLLRCIKMEVNNKKREADLIRKFEKEELKLFYADYTSTFSLGDEGKEWENLYCLQTVVCFYHCRPYVARTLYELR